MFVCVSFFSLNMCYVGTNVFVEFKNVCLRIFIYRSVQNCVL